MKQIALSQTVSVTSSPLHICGTHPLGWNPNMTTKESFKRLIASKGNKNFSRERNKRDWRGSIVAHWKISRRAEKFPQKECLKNHNVFTDLTSLPIEIPCRKFHILKHLRLIFRQMLLTSKIKIIEKNKIFSLKITTHLLHTISKPIFGSIIDVVQHLEHTTISRKFCSAYIPISLTLITRNSFSNVISTQQDLASLNFKQNKREKDLNKFFLKTWPKKSNRFSQ